MRRAVVSSLVVLLVALLALAAPVDAQAVAPCPAAGYSSCAVRAEAGLLSGVHLQRGPGDADAARVHIFGAPDLPALLAGSDSAVAYARRYTGAARRSSALGVVAASLFVAAAVVDLQDREVTDAGLVLVAAGSAVGIASLAQHFSAQRELSRAVWWYNRDLATR